MPRYKLTLEYDGRPYCGFQFQDGLPTVQGSLERALLAFCGQALRISVAGRTDTGVHALAQVAHVDLAKTWPAQVVMNAVNAHLMPEPIAVLAAEVVEDNFDARFRAVSRRYVYRILNRPAPPALDQGRVWHIKKRLDEGAMHDAAQALVGHHDFTTFRDAQCQAKSPERTLDVARVWREDEEVRLEFEARSFLHRQVRSMTGSLAEVGAGRWSVADLKTALEARERRACGPVAPAQGLYLAAVGYPEK